MEQDQSPWRLLHRLTEILQGTFVFGLISLLLAGAALWVSAPERSPSPQSTARPKEEVDFTARIRVVSVSDDEQYLDLLVGDDSLIRRDAHTGADLLTRQIPVENCFLTAISRRGELLATLDSQIQLQVLKDLESVSAEPLPERQPEEELRYCCVSPAGNLAAAISNFGSLWILAIDGSQLTGCRRHSLGQRLDFLEFSPAGDRIALVNSARQFLIWDVRLEKIVVPPTAHRAGSRLAAWSGDGRRLITHGWEKQVRVWNAETAELIQEWESHSPSVSVARLSAEGTLAAIADDRDITLWDVESGAELCTLAEHGHRITDVRFADEDRALFSSDARGGLRRWSLADRRVVWSLP